jgi:four helix bundle protein
VRLGPHQHMGDVSKLSVYGNAVNVADDLRRCIARWESFDRWTLGVQLQRAADSIGANLAEGFGRETDTDRMRFLVIARGSATETEYWLDRALARRLLGDTELLDRARQVCRMLHGLIKSNRP